MTLADSISAGGNAAAIAICLVGAFIAGSFVLHGMSRPTAAMPPLIHSAPPKPRTISHPSTRPARPRVARAPVITLIHDVRRLMTVQYGAVARHAYGVPVTSKPIVQLIRTARRQSWAFGTAVIPVPPGTAAPPSTAFFVAHARHGTWSVAVSGTSAFDRLIKSASGTVVSTSEETLLARFSAAEAAPAGTDATAQAAVQAAGLALPWRAGQSWRLVAAFSGSATASSASMLTFAGGDGQVRAAGPGRLYRFCGRPGSDALIEIIHPSGIATGYYQLRSETTVPDGTLVAAGSYLGMTGTSLACGGTVQGPGTSAAAHGAAGNDVVAFAVLGPAGPVSMDGMVVGGWTFHAQARPTAFWSQHAAIRAALGGLLQNFGGTAQPSAPASPALAPTQTPASSPSPSASPSPAQQNPGGHAGPGQP